MNAVPHREINALVDLVDLKWLLAGEGFHLQVERLQNDPGYADLVFEAAARSRHAILRHVAARVRRQMSAAAA